MYGLTVTQKRTVDLGSLDLTVNGATTESLAGRTTTLSGNDTKTVVNDTLTVGGVRTVDVSGNYLETVDGKKVVTVVGTDGYALDVTLSFIQT